MLLLATVCMVGMRSVLYTPAYLLFLCICKQRAPCRAAHCGSAAALSREERRGRGFCCARPASRSGAAAALLRLS